MIYINTVYEDEVTHQIMLKLFSQVSGLMAEDASILCNGYGKIKKNIKAYNNAAKYGYYFVITDLDTDDCAPSLIRDWLPVQKNSALLFRVAVREVESWLLADRKNFADFLSININLMPFNSDSIPDPKQTVISLAKKSRKKTLRDAIVPIDTYTSIGPGYNIEFQRFIQHYWDIEIALQNSPSLHKAIIALEKVSQKGCNNG